MSERVDDMGVVIQLLSRIVELLETQQEEDRLVVEQERARFETMMRDAHERADRRALMVTGVQGQQQ